MKKSYVVWLVLLPAVALVAGERRHSIEPLHASVETVLDSVENYALFVFEPTTGFQAARLYRVGKESWMLHIVGELEGRPWLLTEKIRKFRFDQIRKKVAARHKRLQEDGNAQFGSPVFSIAEVFKLNLEAPIEVELMDRSVLVGTVASLSAGSMSFVTAGGARLDILDEQIYTVRRRLARVDGKNFFRQDPNQVRLFFGPTGRTLKRGEGHFSDFYILFPTVAVGLTDQFMVGGGISIIPFADSQLGYISPKVRLYHGPGVDVAAGMLYMGVPEEGGFGAVYTAVSTGSAAGGITLGAAIPFDLDHGTEDLAAFLVGGEKQVSEGLKLISENWLFVGDGESLLLVSGGFRFISERMTVGLGFFTIPELIDEFEGFPFIPWLDFSLSFGRL